MTERGACDRMAELLDVYLDRELSAAEMSDVARHVEECADCSRELEERRAFRQRLQRAAQSVEAPANLAATIDRRISPMPRRRPGVFSLALAAAMLTVCFTAWQLARRSLTAQDQNDFLAQVSGGVAQIMRVGLNDHVHCAVFRKYPSQPPSLAEMAALLGPRYADLEPVFAAHLPPGMKVALAHHCHFGDRQYVHLIARNGQKLLSLVIARREQGEAFEDELRAVAWEGETPIYAADATGFSIAGFETPGHLVYVISNLGQAANSHAMEAMAEPVARVLKNSQG